MSKLAHSNDETMRDIETRRLKAQGILCAKCGDSQEKTDWCGESACPQAYENLSDEAKAASDSADSSHR